MDEKVSNSWCGVHCAVLSVLVSAAAACGVPPEDSGVVTELLVILARTAFCAAPRKQHHYQKKTNRRKSWCLHHCRGPPLVRHFHATCSCRRRRRRRNQRVLLHPSPNVLVPISGPSQLLCVLPARPPRRTLSRIVLVDLG